MWTPSFESALHMPEEFVTKCAGISFDIGGSLCKVVYRSRNDVENDKRNQLQMAVFPRHEIKEGLEYIKERVSLTASDDGAPVNIYATGLGSGAFGALITEKLNVSILPAFEMDACVLAHQFLYEHVDLEELEYPGQLSTEQVEDLLKTSRTLRESWTQLERTSDRLLFVEEGMQLEKKMERLRVEGEEEGALYPCLLITWGSGIPFLKIEDPEKGFEMVDSSHTGGKTFMGLASLLLGTVKFDEIIDLAERGNSMHVDSLVGSEEDGSSGLPHFLHCLGQAEGKDIADFSKADLAAALLNMQIIDTVGVTLYVCQRYRLKHVFLAGSFLIMPFIRKCFLREWWRQLLVKASTTGWTSAPGLHIMKQTSFLGAIGCLIKSTQ